MSLKGKNRAIFSYNNSDRNGSNFMYKDFEKTKSYRTDFRNANFNYASLRAAQMKFCNFDGSSFSETEFVGTNLRGSTFKSSQFRGAIFRAVVLEGADFSDASFEDCYFVGTGITSAKKFPPNCNGITFLNSLPSQENYSDELLDIVESLRGNDIIRRSNTLHLKRGKINTLSLMILMQIYTENELIELFPKITRDLSTQFYTLSYLKALLKKASKSDTI